MNFITMNAWTSSLCELFVAYSPQEQCSHPFALFKATHEMCTVTPLSISTASLSKSIYLIDVVFLSIESDAVDRGPDARAYGETGAATPPEFEVTAF